MKETIVFVFALAIGTIIALFSTTDAGAPNVVGAQWAPISSYCLSSAACASSINRFNAINAKNYRFARGDNSIVFVNVTYTNYTYTGPNTWNCYNNYCWVSLTGMLFPKVDEYSYYTVSNVASLASSDVLLVSVSILQNGTLFPTVVSLPWFPEGLSNTAVSSTYYVEYRSIIITLNYGTITNVDWEYTNCDLKACLCFNPSKALTNLPTNENTSYTGLDQYYSTCAYPSVYNATTGISTGQDMNIYIMWAGTDVNGYRLTSASYSVYKISNII